MGLVHRGLDQYALDAYRVGQNVAWRRWMQIAFTLTNDTAELSELLDVTRNRSGVHRRRDGRHQRPDATRACPKVNSRNKVPTVAGAYTPPNKVIIPPARTKSTSSIQSAPTHMPAISVASFGPGLAEPDLIRGTGIHILSANRSASPVWVASAITGTSPAHDTRWSSSKRADAGVKLCRQMTKAGRPRPSVAACPCHQLWLRRSHPAQPRQQTPAARQGRGDERLGVTYGHRLADGEVVVWAPLPPLPPANPAGYPANYPGCPP